jgi:hypothetical protein
MKKMSQEGDAILEVMKEKARAVLSIVDEVPDLAEAFRYAVGITAEQGGKAIADPVL